MPWKNGRGITFEIAVWPPTAGLDDFDWRLSTALISEDAAFSSFPGIDRTLAIVSGHGVDLTFEPGRTIRLDRQSVPLSFAADRPVHARLVNGPIVDLNVMTRRGHWRHQVRALPARTVPVNPTKLGVCALYVRAGAASLTDPALRLCHGDTLLIEAGEEGLLNPGKGADILAVDLEATETKAFARWPWLAGERKAP
jgi:environmental stress-induced protein Ves